MNVEIGTEAPIFLFWVYLFRNFGILSLQCIGLPFYCSFFREVAYHLDAHMRQVPNFCLGANSLVFFFFSRINPDLNKMQKVLPSLPPCSLLGISRAMQGKGRGEVLLHTRFSFQTLLKGPPVGFYWMALFQFFLS